MQFEFLDCYHNLFSPLMARKSSKCATIVDPNQIGCVWNFGGMFDHRRRLHHLLLHHGRRRQQLLLDESQRIRSPPVAGQEKSQTRMLTFDEQLRSINIELKKNADGKDEFWKKTMEKSFWKKIKSRYEYAKKKKENTKFIDKLTVLKPSECVVECPVDMGCGRLFLQPHHNHTSEQHVEKYGQISVNNDRKRMKSSKKLKSFQKLKSCCGTDENTSKAEKLSLVQFYNHQEPEVFVEARKHLAERLRLVVMGAGGGAGVTAGEPLGYSCQEMPRTLERVLLSSPVHESMVALECEPEGAHGEKSLQQVWRGPSPLKHSEYSSASGFVEIRDANDQFKENLNPSPVSVLDLFLSDSIDSPTSTIESAEHPIQPRRLEFEEQSAEGFSLFADDPQFVSSYVNDIYRISQSKWEDLLATGYPSSDHKLLHDCIKEMLASLHSKRTFFSSKIQSFSSEKDVVNKVIDLVDWHNGQHAGSRTLDHLVRWDIAKCGPWLDTLSDKDDLVVEVVDETLVELIIEVVHDICF